MGWGGGRGWSSRMRGAQLTTVYEYDLLGRSVRVSYPAVGSVAPAGGDGGSR